MRTIRLLAEFKCFPLWEDGIGGVLNLDPNELPISKKLKEDLYRWMKSFDDIYDADYPPDSSFNNIDEENKFIATGEKITKDLTRELGKEFNVIYRRFR